MDMLITGTILGIFFIVALVVVRTMVDKRFPPVPIDVHDGGLRAIIQYRLLGTTIVEDNIFALLMNQFIICGDIMELEHDLVPQKMLFFTTGYKKVWRAYRRFGYLCGVIDKNKTTPEIMKDKSKFVIDKNKELTISKNGLLVPYRFEFVNEKLTEKEVLNGKAICSRFIEAQRANKQFNETTNPLITTLIYSIPLFLIVVGLGVVIYLSFTGANESAMKVVDGTNKVVEHVDSLITLLNQTKRL